MPVTPRRTRQTHASHHDIPPLPPSSTPQGSSAQGSSSFQTPNRGSRLRTTRSTAASANTWTTNTSPNNSFTTPTRTPRQHTTPNGAPGSGNAGGGNGGGNGGVSGNGNGGGGNGNNGPGSASSTSTSRQLRGPPIPNPQVSLKRTSGSSGSLSGTNLDSITSLSELSPGGARSRTPNSVKKTPFTNQSMKVIPSPFAHSPAGWRDTQYLPSPWKGSSAPSGSSRVPGSAAGVSAGGDGASSFEHGMDQFFAPADTNRERAMVDNMREWRTDALHQHLNCTAAFWGDKVMSITEDMNDVFWLSQVYYLTGEYERAVNLLQQRDLVRSSVACRFLAIQCMIKTKKWPEALEYLGEENHFLNGDTESEAEGGIKLEASMCHLRGIVFKNMNNIERAKECFKEALRIDVKCYDSLEYLVFNNMLKPAEERDFIEELGFNKQLPDRDASFVKMLYQTKMKKFDNLELQNDIYTTLSSNFQGENVDLLHSRAEIYFTQCRFDKCLEYTKRILKLDKFNLACIPMHLVSLYEGDLKNELFFIAHELVDRHPKNAVAWFAVGVYYYLIRSMVEARRYFSKASTIDSHYGPAWLGFGHSFAAEGEHDQAIAAYSTSTKLFQGSHLGSMYIGMQHLQQNNLVLAQKYLTTGLHICDSDPLLLNELGVLYYNLAQYEDAVEYFLKVLQKLSSSHRKNIIWETTWLNLAHAYRKQGKYEDAEVYFLKVDAASSIGQTKAAALVGLGFIYQIMGQLSDAIEAYHRVLAIRPSDPVASEMLQKVMEDATRVAETEWIVASLPEELREDEESLRLRHLAGWRAGGAGRKPKMGSLSGVEAAEVGGVSQARTEEILDDNAGEGNSSGNSKGGGGSGGGGGGASGSGSGSGNRMRFEEVYEAQDIEIDP